MLSIMLSTEIEEDVGHMLKFVEKPAEKKSPGWPGCRFDNNSADAVHYVDRYNHVRVSVYYRFFM
jgi:hypothetical protein